MDRSASSSSDPDRDVTPATPRGGDPGSAPDESVELYDGARSGETYLGFTPNPGETVRVQALRTTNVGRTSAAARWTTLGSAVSGTTPAATSGGVDYYAYNISAPAPRAAQWPTGGVARLRIRYGTGASGTNGNTFDDLGCF